MADSSGSDNGKKAFSFRGFTPYILDPPVIVIKKR